MKKLVLLSLLFLSVGCVGIPADMIDTSVNNITARYDTYVTADPTLSQEQKDVLLQESLLLRQVVEEAKK